jgi:glycosyltransferase involved in cell wall biosynthesis
MLPRFARAGFRVQAFPIRRVAHDYRRLVSFLLRERLALVQSNGYSPIAAMAAATAGIPHVWRVGGHSDVVLAGRALSERRRFLGLMGGLSRAVVCNSEFVRDGLRAAGVLRVRLVRNGVPAVAAWKPRAPGPFRVAMVAHFYPEKRHLDFVRAAALVARSCPGVRFAVYGSSWRQRALLAHERRVRAAAGRLRGVRIAVRLTPRGEDAIANGDLLVLPGQGESCSNAILEAMAAGRPVVAAASGGNAELIRDGVTGLLVEPGRPALLARAILALVGDARRWERMGKSARRRALRSFSMDACVDAYVRCYREVASR